MIIIWVVHALFRNPLYTGLAGFMAAAPGIVSFLAGPFIDRFSKVTLLRIACFTQFCVTAVLFALPPDVLSGRAWVVLLTVLIFNIARIIALPAGVALLPKIVDSDNLVKANSMISICSIFGGFGIVSLLFILMDRVDFRVIFAINSVILLIGLANSIKLRISEDESHLQINAKTYFHDLKEGLVFVANGTMLPLMLSLVSVRFVSEIVSVSLPMFVDTYGGTASGYMLYMIFGMLGGTAGPMISGPVGRKFSVSKIFIVGYIAAGVSWLIFVNVAIFSFFGALPINALFGVIVTTITIFAQTLTQRLPPPHTVARISTIKTSLYNTSAAIGALLGGFLGGVIPSVGTILSLQGAAYITIAILLCLSAKFRALPKICEI